MKLHRYLLAALIYGLPASAWAQCTGTFASGEVCANATAGSAPASPVTVSSLFDRAFCSTANASLWRISGSWVCLASASNSVLVTDGSGVPSLVAATGTGNVMRATAPTMTGNLILNGNWLSGDGGNEGLSVDSAGLVGVGTLTPSNPLTVQNNSSALFTTFINNLHASGVGLAVRTAGSGAHRALTVQTGTTDKFVVLGNGNVGVGTASPPSLLSVSTNFLVDASGATKTSSGGIAINAATITTSGDQSTALNAALAAYDIVQLPCGTFQVAQQIVTPRAGQTFKGSGRCTVVQNTNATPVFGVVFSNGIADVTVSDMTIDLGAVSGTSCLVAVASVRFNTNNVACKNFGAVGGSIIIAQDGSNNGSHYSKVTNCYVQGQVSNGVPNLYISASTHVTVSGCTIIDSESGIGIAASDYAVVTGNNIKGTSNPPANFGGIRCTNGTQNATITANTITDTPVGFVIGGGCKYSSFTGNTVLNTRFESIWLSSGDATETGSTYFNTIMSNAFRNACRGGCVQIPQTAVVLQLTGTATSGQIQSNIVVGNTYRDTFGDVTTMIGITGGVVAGFNECSLNRANVTVGGC